jgi:hypothetical protein
MGDSNGPPRADKLDQENTMGLLVSKAKGIALAAVAAAMLAGGSIAVSTTPAEAGASTGTWRYAQGYRYGYRGAYRPYYGYRRYNRGGAVAAGVATGLALGALGAAAASPYYGYPAYGPAPVYSGDCYWVNRRAYDPWGNLVIRRVQVCD